MRPEKAGGTVSSTGWRFFALRLRRPGRRDEGRYISPLPSRKRIRSSADPIRGSTIRSGFLMPAAFTTHGICHARIKSALSAPSAAGRIRRSCPTSAGRPHPASTAGTVRNAGERCWAFCRRRRIQRNSDSLRTGIWEPWERRSPGMQSS